ncbi:hypothetical protein ABU614_03380 [Lysobacter firmicutimachus]|uniref:Uncharacterized protein n=1 Tax=Lysobacter firmicutimachus TaxID=1792846 RepID=A0AAU8MRV4_9GAMM
MAEGVLIDMSNSMKTQIEIARLDGLLSGLAGMNERIGSYSAFAYVVELREGLNSIEEGIKAHYSWLPEMEFSQSLHLGQGLRDLEIGIRPFLVRGWGGIDLRDLVALGEFMSFRVMEIISAATDEALDLQVHKLVSVGAASESHCVFFCIRFEEIGIVMQFNDDTGFRGAG